MKNVLALLAAAVLPLAAADKRARVIGLYDVTVHFQDPAIHWEEISDAFVKQFLVDTGANQCIQPNYLPQRILGNREQQTHVGPEGTAGLDYVAFGDLYKDASGYRMEAYLVTGKSRQIVLKRVQPPFTDAKQAPFQAQMAALNLRLVGNGTRTLADLIFDFEKRKRQEQPKDHAIAPQLRVELAESERYPLKLKAGEARPIQLSLMDCDGVALKGADVQIETITGQVAPGDVLVNAQGSGKFTYTAPQENANGQIRVAFIYVRGSEHPGNPEVDSINVRVGTIDAWNGALTFRSASKVNGRDGGKTYTGQVDESATYSGIFRADPSASDQMAWRIVGGSGNAKIADEYFENDQGTSQRTANTGQNSASVPDGAIRLLLAKDDRSYSIEFTRVTFRMKYTIYEVNEPNTVWQEPAELLWYAPSFTLTRIPMPAQGDRLTGSRRIRIPVPLHIGEAAPIEAEVSWSFDPVSSTPPKR